MSTLQGLFGFTSLTEVIQNAFGNVFADIWCVALFTLVDLGSPHVQMLLNSTGMLNGLGGTLYYNLVHVLKLQLFAEWKDKFNGFKLFG